MLSRRTFLATGAAALGAPLVGSPLFARHRVGAIASSSFDPWLEIDADALAHNARTVALLAGGRPIIAVVKNNAYGLGLETAGPILDRLPEIQSFAVVRADEALTLRRAGVRKAILLMGPASEDDLMELAPHDVIHSLHLANALETFARVAERLRHPVRVQVYVDTGMHRMGIPHTAAIPSIQTLAATNAVRIEGAFTELVEDPDFDREQARRLRTLQSDARAKGVVIGPLHAASSDAVMHGTSDAFLDAVRPGLALYGGYVSDRAMARGELRPSFSLKARVIRVDHVAAGEGVSYHRRWSTDRPAWTATLAVGHVDGYPSGATKGCEVLVRGRLFPVIGTVSASHTVIHLGETQAADVGDEATLVGREHAALHPNEVAKRAGWSEYNMFMHLSPRLRRLVRSGSQ